MARRSPSNLSKVRSLDDGAVKHTFLEFLAE